ncbi:MAG: hypothetical protein WC371_04755 [Parachlamydiales bacterium]|jgi:hypothetical protein
MSLFAPALPAAGGFSPATLPFQSQRTQGQWFKRTDQLAVKICSVADPLFSVIETVFSAAYLLSFGAYLFKYFRFIRLPLEISSVLQPFAFFSAAISSGFSLALKVVKLKKSSLLAQEPLVLLSQFKATEPPQSAELESWREKHQKILQTIRINSPTAAATTLYEELKNLTGDFTAFSGLIWKNFQQTYLKDQMLNKNSPRAQSLQELFRGTALETLQEELGKALADPKTENLQNLSHILRSQINKNRLFTILSITALALTIIGVAILITGLFHCLPAGLIMAGLILWWGGWALNIIIKTLHRGFLGETLWHFSLASMLFLTWLLPHKI